MTKLVTYEDIKAQLDKDEPGLFLAKNGLMLHKGLPPNLEQDSAGVWISEPLTSRELQMPTIGGEVAVYDEDVSFVVIFVTSKKNSNAQKAQTAVECLGRSELFKDFYAKPFQTSDVHNPSNIEVDYGFTFNRTVVI